MKGKKISDYNPMSLGGLMTSMSRIIYGQNFRSSAINTKGDKFTVDTAIAPDTFVWETGIESPNFNNGDWVIVDEYETKREAESGHKKWVKFMESNPKKLTDIHIDETYKLIK